MNVGYKAPDHIYFRSVRDEVVILDARSDEYLGLNETAAAVWLCLVEGGSAELAVSQLISAYQVDETTARNDVSALLRQFLDGGLLVPME